MPMSTELAQELLSETANIDELAKNVSQRLHDNSFTLLALVESLGPLLTSSNQLERLRGINILSAVLSEIPSELLTEDELKFITQFYCEKTGDQFIIVPATLSGFLALLKMTNLPKAAPADILLTLRSNVTCQALPQPCRLTYYSILGELLSEHHEKLRKISNQYVHHVILSMEAESDPRNLVKIFSMLPRLFKTFELEKELVEEAFGVLECYFPVDFAPREIMDITREDLAEGLENCLLATPVFGPFIVPVILDKLDSRLKVAHIDSLKLLKKGAQIWDLDCICHNLPEFENILKTLIFPGSDPEVTDLAIQTIVSLITRLSTSASDVKQPEALNHLLEFITSSTHIFLRDSTLSMFLPAAKVLHAVAQASSSGCYHVTNNVVKQILALLEAQSENQGIILAALQPLLYSTVYFAMWEMSDEAIKTTLSTIPEVLIKKLKSSESKAGCFLCLGEIVSCLTQEQRIEIYDFILDSTPKESKQQEREACAKYVTTVARQFPEETRINLLSKVKLVEEEGHSEDEVGRSIDILCWASHVLELTPFAISKILSCITTGTKVTPVAVSCLRDLCIKLHDREILKSLGVKCKLPEKLLSCWLKFLQSSPNLCTSENLQSVSKIIDCVVKILNSSEQTLTLSECFPLFNFQEEGTSRDKIILLESLLGSLRRDVVIPKVEELASVLIDHAIHSETLHARVSSSRLLAAIINKTEANVESLLSNIDNQIKSFLDEPKVVEAVELQCWITKGLVLRAHSQMNVWLDKMIENLQDVRCQMVAAQGFQLILTDSELFLNLESYCNVRILYKQRVFECVNRLTPLLKENEGSSRRAVSLAIGHILIAAPRPILISKIKELIPVIISCLDNDDPIVVTALLQVVSGLLANGEPIMIDYIDTFLPRCINYSVHQSMKVRMEAIDCLYHYGRYKEEVVLPYKTKVTHGLVPCLDDKKRLVRRKAVKARTAWFLLGSLPNKNDS